MSKKPVVLMILDGYGLNDNCDHNAVCEGRTPVMDQLMSQCPFVKGNASGLAVGLPDGQMGNSEVGHLNMGAGRIVYQELTRITKSIQDGDFFDVPEFLQAVENCRKNDSALHLWGLVSDGGVHSHNTHIYGLLELARRNGLDKVYVHCFLDGRDTPPASGKGYVEELEAKMKELGVGKVASVMGRYYAMDRDNRWDRVERAYNALTRGEGGTAVSAAAGIQASYDAEVNDEFVEPFVVVEDGKPVATVKDNDSVIFFNFRPDRAREITRAFCDDDFKGFARDRRLNLTYVCFTDYDDTIANKLVAFKKEAIVNTFGQFLADHDMVVLTPKVNCPEGKDEKNLIREYLSYSGSPVCSFRVHTGDLSFMQTVGQDPCLSDFFQEELSYEKNVIRHDGCHDRGISPCRLLIIHN